MKKLLAASIEKLGAEFPSLNWAFVKESLNRREEIISYWPGDPNDDVMICVLKAKRFYEEFHRQDFFFLNYAYLQDYQALSSKYDNLITVRQDECYIGQPFSGYALRGDAAGNIVIIGVLIKKETFFREYLPTLSSDQSMFRFFLEPQTNRFSDEFIRLSFGSDSPVRALLEMMVVEYAHRSEDTQAVLNPMILSLFMLIAREYRKNRNAENGLTVSERVIRYMGEHSGNVSLKEIAAHLSYHPNYLSALLKRETGRTFSELLTAQRMERALLLLDQTPLPIDEIAPILGYTNNSNFYRAFREYYGVSPREYQRRDRLQKS